MKPMVRSPGLSTGVACHLQPRKRATPGFTRFELLVLVAGVTLTGLLAVPTLGQSREKAVRVSCRENLSRIGRAARTFAANHGGRNPAAVPVSQGGVADYFPGGATAGKTELWRHYWVLSNELVNPIVLICPSDSGRYLPRTWADMVGSATRGRNTSISYGVGLAAVAAKPDMVLAADRTINWPVGALRMEYNGSATRGNVGTNVAALQSMEWDQRSMHAGSGNLLRADGSVATLTSTRLRAIWLETGDAANNYGQPGKSANN